MSESEYVYIGGTLRKRSVYVADYTKRNKENVLIRRKSKFKIKYSMTLEDYDRMLKEQDGHCKLCPNVIGTVRQARLDIDHCHRTNKVRGLLCRRCNMLIAAFDELGLELLKKVAEYLNHA